MASETRVLTAVAATAEGSNTQEWNVADSTVTVARLNTSDNLQTLCTAASFDNGVRTKVIYTSAYGYNIPTDATIDGIVVTFERACPTGGATDDIVQLTKVAGTKVGNNLATATAWPATDTTEDHGSSSNLSVWGVGFTPTEVNASGFGVAVASIATVNNTDIQIDLIQITVYWTPAGGAAAPALPPSGRALVGVGF